jgi:DNA-binding beta-propeller fold protein YncE
MGHPRSPLHISLAAIVASVLVAVAPMDAVAQPKAAPAPVVFSAPASERAAGSTSAADDYGRILPSGRILHPAGTSVVVGMNALGFALSPDGRYAIVSNDDGRQAKTHSAIDPLTTGGYSLSVVDTATMTVVSRYTSPADTFFSGVVALADPTSANDTLVLASGGSTSAVYAFDLSPSGALKADAHPVIPIPVSTDERGASAGRAFPSTLVLSANGTRAFVVDVRGNDVAQIDTATRSLFGSPIAVGFFPYGAALSSLGLVVANEGLGAYGALASPAAAPSFATVAPDLSRASSLALIPTLPDSSLGAATSAYVPLDRTPDGIRAVGGAHPAAVVALKTRPLAFVALANVDRVATVSLEAVGLAGAAPAPRAVGGTELRLYDRGPYGTQPSALALSADEKRLYVALAGIDAIAVLDTTDPLHPHRIGLIPTGWYPDALALSSDGRYLYVANAKGLAEDRGFAGDQASLVDASGRVQSVAADGSAVWSTFERIDLASLDLRKTTPNALSYLRKIDPAKTDSVVPQRFAGVGSSAIKHVVLILEESKTYDSMLGDLTDASGAPYGPGDAGYVSFGSDLTPNLHELARTFGLAGNFYADAAEAGASHQVVSAGIASDFTERTSRVEGGRRPPFGNNENPEDYPRAGYIFNSLADRGKSYRDYGDLLRVSGYAESDAAEDDAAATRGLGGLYTLDVPALAALAGHVDLNYPGWNPRVRDVRRAAEFMRDFDPLVKSAAMPSFTEIWLPGDRDATGTDVPALADEVADGDRALGSIVAYLSHAPQWRSTAILIMPADAGSTRDHVDEHRSFAIVVSPYAKRHYVGMRHVSTASVLKTEEEILGLPALSLGDELATDLSDFFDTVPNATPYVAKSALP